MLDWKIDWNDRMDYWNGLQNLKKRHFSYGQLEKQGAGNGTGTGTGTGAGAGPERYRITSLIRAIKWV